MAENYLGRENPWSLAGPPAWVLAQMGARDADLVLLPGLSEPVYRLARRVRRSHGLLTAALGHDSETARMIKHRLMPVTTLFPPFRWGHLFQWLDDHDMWAVGGADKADEILAAQDEAERARIARDRETAFDAITSAGWEAKQRRAGERILMSGEPSRAA